MNLESMITDALEAMSPRANVQQGGSGKPPVGMSASGELAGELEPEYLSVNGVCKMLGVSRAKWYYLTDPKHKYFDPTIPPWKPIGRRGRKYRRVLIVAWVEGGATGGSAS